MSFLDKTLTSILSVKSDYQLKALALVILGAIVIMAFMPFASGKTQALSAEQLTVMFLGVAGITVVILSDRIVSLKFQKDKLELKLAQMKDEMNEVLSEAREEIGAGGEPSTPSAAPSTPAEIQPDLSRPAPPVDVRKTLDEAECLLKRKGDTDDVASLLEEAGDIGKVMGMLREVLKAYRRTKGKEETESETSKPT